MFRRGWIWLSARFTQLLDSDLRDQPERDRQVHVTTAIGASVGLLFAIYNLSTEGMMALGLIELGAVMLLVVPAFFMSRRTGWSEFSESLLLLAAMVIFGALIVLGGVEGSGLFWVYTAPFLAFFLKGQRSGWRYCLGFLALVIVYLAWLAPQLPFSYRHSPTLSLHFVLSLVFYTLVAAAFNHVGSRSEQQLRLAQAATAKAMQELQLSKEKTEAAYAAKTRFLAAASHDLRQPAHALGLFVAQLEQGPVTPELVRGLDASVSALQEMLDVFFDYSRLDTLSGQVSTRPVQIEQLFRQLRVLFANLAAQKGLRLRIRSSAAWVQTDPVLLQRILLNLVSNAVRYTARGSILVSCRVRQGQARIEIRDSGIGIAPEHHDKIFEEFFQVRNQARDRSQGLGLGLSMVQRTCELLHHPLSLRSALHRGSCFTLTVPLAQGLGIDNPGAPAQATAFKAGETAPAGVTSKPN